MRKSTALRATHVAELLYGARTGWKCKLYELRAMVCEARPDLFTMDGAPRAPRRWPTMKRHRSELSSAVPVLSVVLPVYNAMPWLPATMHHLLRQRLEGSAD